MFIYFQEKQSVSGVREEREEDTESKAGFRLWAVSTEPGVGLKLMNYEIMTWALVRRSTDWATQAPLNIFKINVYLFLIDSMHIFSSSSILLDFLKKFLKLIYTFWDRDRERERERAQMG